MPSINVGENEEEGEKEGEGKADGKKELRVPGSKASVITTCPEAACLPPCRPATHSLLPAGPSPQPALQVSFSSHYYFFFQLHEAFQNRVAAPRLANVNSIAGNCDE